MYAAMEDLFYYGCDHPNTSQSKVQKYLKKRFDVRLKKYGVQKEKAVMKFYLKKVKKNWRIYKLDGVDYFAIMDINNAMDDWERDYEDYGNDDYYW